MEEYERYTRQMPNPPEFIAGELERVRQLKAMKPVRTISLLLDAMHGYAVAERGEFTADGGKIVHIVSDNWQFYPDAGIWLPGRCVASHYSRRLNILDLSPEPVHFATNELIRAEFGKQNIPFAFDGVTKGPRGQ